MAILTPADVLGLAMTCQTMFAPTTLAKIIQFAEWHGAPMHSEAISQPNRDGSRDYGLAQINEKNFPALHLTRETALDPCISVHAEAEVIGWMAGYNTGKKTSTVGIAYAERAITGRLARGSPSIPHLRHSFQPLEETFLQPDAPENETTYYTRFRK